MPGLGDGQLALTPGCELVGGAELPYRLPDGLRVGRSLAGVRLRCVGEPVAQLLDQPRLVPCRAVQGARQVGGVLLDEVTRATGGAHVAGRGEVAGFRTEPIAAVNSRQAVRSLTRALRPASVSA